MAVDVLRRILIRANDDSAGPNTLFLFDEALRDERRAVVERLRLRFRRIAAESDKGMIRLPFAHVVAILDEEAAS